jgi:hypothetical protein
MAAMTKSKPSTEWMASTGPFLKDWLPRPGVPAGGSVTYRLRHAQGELGDQVDEAGLQQACAAGGSSVPRAGLSLGGLSCLLTSGSRARMRPVRSLLATARSRRWLARG